MRPCATYSFRLNRVERFRGLTTERVIWRGSFRRVAELVMRIGILGSGLMGGTLGTIFARAGHEVVFSYACSALKLRRLAREASRTARPGTPREAVQEADALLLAVHWSCIDDVLEQAGDLSGKVVVTCSLPMNADNNKLVVAHTSSGAEELARRIVGARVVSAFNTVPSAALLGVFYEARRKTTRPSLVYCGDDEQAKNLTADLIKDAGFDPVDAGSLRFARYTEPFALLIAALAYESKVGPERAYRFEGQVFSLR
jgi:8-hydroxy-5-deazaflavin:NADPH oxidoreductase